MKIYKKGTLIIKRYKKGMTMEFNDPLYVYDNKDIVNLEKHYMYRINSKEIALTEEEIKILKEYFKEQV